MFIVAAILTPDGSPWNQTLVAAPMIGLYLFSIGIAWIVGTTRSKETSSGADSTKLRLVFAATVIDQARRHRTSVHRTDCGETRARPSDGGFGARRL